MLNHVWQSTVFAVVVGLLTLALRKNRAQTRYWVWLAASLKFLVPLALLVGIGNSVSWRSEVDRPFLIPTVVERISQPFAEEVGEATPVSVRTRVNPLPELSILVWACGSVVVLLRWGRKWMRMRAIVRAALPMDLGLPIPVKASPEMLEPGVFGVVRPVLLLPEGITQKLTHAQFGAILAHEMCHARRRDNLTTAIHMVVEAMFWFHPLVWWIGARLVDERERACDEEVLRAGSDAQAYAEGILNVCKLYLESPLKCVAGVTGSNLSKRIEDIMANRGVSKLNARRKLLLAGAGVLAVAGPVAVGVINAPPIRAQSGPAGHFEFEVASVKPAAPGDNNFGLRFLPGGRVNAIVPIEFLISFAYNLGPDPSARLTGGPDWTRSVNYDVEATSVMPSGLSQKASLNRIRLMVQSLLMDRFKLVMHRGSKEMPVYALVVAKDGPKLQKADIEENGCSDADTKPPPGTRNAVCHVLMGGEDGIHGQAVDMSDLAEFVENFTDRPLLDKTGISGLYHIEMTGWQRMQPGGAEVSDLPTIFTVFRTLGLKMESTKDKVDVYVIDHLEKPSGN